MIIVAQFFYKSRASTTSIPKGGSLFLWQDEERRVSICRVLRENQISEVMVVEMSSAMDKAMFAMNLVEEYIPFDMPALPQFCSSEDNVLSLIGRILNPERQKVSNLLLDLPRKWQKIGRIRGVALSKERFQFIFKFEHDLIEILEKGVHTYNEWATVLVRWVEIPPADFLQHIPMWIQIRQIPVNHYTVPEITLLGELIGRVIEVAYDPTKSQHRDFVRIQVRFDVSKPLRRYGNYAQ